MSGYYPAQICLNGHVISACENNIENFCSECGAKTITSCPECNIAIRGMYNYDYPVIGQQYKIPAYCFSCGNAFPWTQSKLEAINELIEFDEQLSDDEKNYINTNASSLVVDTPKTKVVATKLNSFLRKAGSITSSAIRDILVDVASETAKKIIFPQQ